MAEQRGHVDRAALDQPHRVRERAEPGLALRAGDRIGGQELPEELGKGERVVAGALRQAEPEHGGPRRGQLQAQRERLPAADRLPPPAPPPGPARRPRVPPGPAARKPPPPAPPEPASTARSAPGCRA